MAKVVETTDRDLLDRLREAQAELESLRRELDHTHQLATLGTLMAGIAHEINNILTPVLAYAQLARNNPHDGTLRTKALDRAIAGVQSASRITEAILGFSRHDGEDDMAMVNEVVEGTLACMGRDPTRDGVKIVVDVSQDVAVKIRPLALQQVLLNLTLNALNAMHGRPGVLRITARELDDGTTRINVSDTGPGIPAAMAARLFDPFVSGHECGRPTPTGHGGSGLGLAVCRRLVESSGGTITLDPDSVRKGDERADGARFTITLRTHVATPDDRKAA